MIKTRHDFAHPCVEQYFHDVSEVYSAVLTVTKHMLLDCRSLVLNVPVWAQVLKLHLHSDSGRWGPLSDLGLLRVLL